MSNFQKEVLNVVSKISKGRVLTYKEVAKLSGYKDAYRAVGSLMRKNKRRDIPCHRVVCADGTCGKYNKGDKLKIKKLTEEGIKFNQKGKIQYL